jgi:hypothetical protein
MSKKRLSRQRLVTTKLVEYRLANYEKSIAFKLAIHSANKVL